jgi:hypothetical protein
LFKEHYSQYSRRNPDPNYLQTTANNIKTQQPHEREGETTEYETTNKIDLKRGRERERQLAFYNDKFSDIKVKNNYNFKFNFDF